MSTAELLIKQNLIEKRKKKTQLKEKNFPSNFHLQNLLKAPFLRCCFRNTFNLIYTQLTFVSFFILFPFLPLFVFNNNKKSLQAIFIIHKLIAIIIFFREEKGDSAALLEYSMSSLMSSLSKNI